MKSLESREQQLQLLVETWNTLKGPQHFVITGFSGIGKTHFISEFYEFIAKDSSYWRALQKTRSGHHKVIDHTPGFAALEADAQMEWLWLAARCFDSGRINGNADTVIFYERIRYQFTFHLLGLIKSIRHKAANRKLAKSAITALTHLALPGSGIIDEIYTFVKDIYSDSNDLIDFVKSIVDKSAARSSSSSDFFNQEVKGLLETSVSLFSEVFRANPDFKIIIYFDDVQWLDSYSQQVVAEVFTKAIDSGWNILFLYSGWHPSYTGIENVPGADYEQFFKMVQTLPERATILSLLPLSRQDIIRVVKQRMPHLQIEAVYFLADRCRGDIDLLHDYVDELLASPGWLDSEGRLTVTTADLADLPSRAVDMARKKLNVLPAEVRETLLWSSLQGVTFFQKLIEQLLLLRSHPVNYEEHIRYGDSGYGIVDLKEHRIVKHSGEFRRAVFYEACLSIFSRHPQINTIKLTLLEICYEFITSQDWAELEGDKRNQLIYLYNELVLHFQPADDKYGTLRISLLIIFAENRLLTGDYTSTVNILESIYNDARSLPQRAEINKVLVQAFYAGGLLHREYEVFRRWEQDGGSDNFSFLTLFAKYLRRVSKPIEALDYSNQASALASNPKQVIEARLEQAKCFWSAGLMSEAKQTIISLEEQFSKKDLLSYSQDVNYHHTCCLVLHDLDQNKEVITHAKECIKGYQQSGDIQLQIISAVNLGDALFGIGYLEEAARVLVDACKMAEDYQLPHCQDIAYICYANVLTDLGKHAEARSFYEKGLTMAESIGHDWDTIYGNIYFGILGIYEKRAGLPDDFFTSLSSRAEKAGYQYLANLALAAHCVFINMTGIKDSDIPLLNAKLNLPGSRLYYMAAMLLSGSEDEFIMKEFLELLGKTQGTKLSRDFIFKCINKMLGKGLITDSIDNYFLTRWKNLYTKKIERNIETRVKTCDYRLCEATCCYDGVYLSDEDEQKIKEAVSAAPEFFRHLPEDFIVTSEWKNVSGRKTNTRPHCYKSPDFPKHFNQTRCVFAFEDGACSLQSYSMQYASDPWLYKPKACKIHPLQVAGTDFYAPPTNNEQDKYNVGINYPGYVSYTPCGHNRHDGNVWFEELSSEITEFLKPPDD